MVSLLGEYTVKLDGKSRIQFPSAFRKQMTSEEMEKFVLKTGKRGCLELYPFVNWKAIGSEISKMNPYGKKSSDFQYIFMKGAVEVELDSTLRILIPKKLNDYAELSDECTLFARGIFIEIWDKSKFDKLATQMDDEEFESITETVFGNLMNKQS